MRLKFSSTLNLVQLKVFVKIKDYHLNSKLHSSAQVPPNVITNSDSINISSRQETHIYIYLSLRVPEALIVSKHQKKRDKRTHRRIRFKRFQTIFFFYNDS